MNSVSLRTPRRSPASFLVRQLNLPTNERKIGWHFVSLGLVLLAISLIIFMNLDPNFMSINFEIDYNFYFSLMLPITASLLFISNGIKFLRRPENYQLAWLRIIIPGAIFAFTAISGFILGSRDNLTVLSFWLGLCGLMITLYFAIIWVYYIRMLKK